MKSIQPVGDASIRVKQWDQCRRCPDRTVITKDWGDCVGGRGEVEGNWRGERERDEKEERK